MALFVAVMILGDYLVVTLTTLNIVASAAYFVDGDFHRGIYWVGAFLLTGSTLFMGR